jgi:hypothetical protein
LGQKVDLPARRARQQRGKHTHDNDGDWQWLGATQHLTEVFERNLLQQVVDRERTDREADRDLNQSCYDRTS